MDEREQPTKEGPTESLYQFLHAEKMETRKVALSALIATKFLPKNSDNETVLAGRERLLDDAFAHPEPASRLLAIAESIRLTQVVRRWLPHVKLRLEHAFDSPLPPMSLLPGADDRLNLARGCGLFEREWLPNYLAASAAQEEQGEKTRAELIGALVERSPTLNSVLVVLLNHFSHARPTTESPADSLAKRLTRTLAALRERIVDSDKESGDDLGKSLYALVAEPFREVGRPQDEKTKIDLSSEALLTVHDLVRTRLSLVADPNTYQVVGYCRKLFGSATWPSELSGPLEMLIRDVCEALILLGRQGMRQQGLLDQLEMLCKYPERARVLSKELAARHPEFDESVRDWLEHGRVRLERPSSEAAIEASASNADAVIGLALQAARQSRQATEGLRDRLVSGLEIYEPTLALPASEALDRVKALAAHVEQVALLRGLQLFGIPGEEIEFSPKFFEIIGDNPRNRMIVRQPAVVKIRPGSAAGDVVLRGLVE